MQPLVFGDRHRYRLLAFGIRAFADKLNGRGCNALVISNIFFDCPADSPVPIANNLFVFDQLIFIHI